MPLGTREWVTALLALAVASAHSADGAGRIAPPAASVASLGDSVVAADLARADSLGRLGYPDGLLAMATADVIYLRGGEPVVFGRANAREMLAGKLAAAGFTVRWQPLRVGVSADGRAAYTAGIAASSAAGDSGRAVLRVDRYIAFWRRGTDGGWRVAAYSEVGPPLVASPPTRSAGRPARAPGTARQDSLARVLVQTDSVFSALAGRSDLATAFSDYAAPEAMIFSGTEVIVGPGAIHGNFAGPSTGVLAWHAVAAEVVASGDLGFTVGEYTFTPSDRGATGRRGKYLTVWAPQPGGRWKYVVDGGSESPAP